MALAAVIETLRPEWSAAAIAKAVSADDRPWRTVVLASIRGAADHDIRHPNGLRLVNPVGAADAGVPVLPTVAEALNPQLCEQHEFRVGACPMCRRTR